MVDVSIVEEDEKYIKAELDGIPLSIANGIRRFTMNEVPVMAVEEILIIENTSAMHNEVLAHRISLIPFISDIDRYVAQEECTCGSRLGCERCVVRYVLRAEARDEPVTVYSRDIIPEDANTTVKPVSPKIPIVKLAPGQRLEMELYVRVGRGRKNAKWQAAISSLYEKDGEPGKRILYIESIGFLPPRRILKEAVNIFKKKVQELDEKIKRELEG
ncbi:MAG: DNA-directed RNA polymerase subunit D [Aigarchaeota archaeon]|nr:DNA-directed RNA polymerase subunit D [Aigarchaeota archaeon]MCX8193185.1 DNA-directed RNA polymerase subunit D [Nitrososphaeria archaeon]MDW7986326.1 DNA-directed RNA polymerase subunit D [Nitrososphaerota archaeon]